MAPRYAPIETRISPDLLDTIGKNFKFKHAKGVSEWLKNSLDNYLRLRDVGLESRHGNWPVVLALFDAAGRNTGPNLAVIDFGGTSLQDVESFFLHWGDRSAATLGGASTAAVTGGHGNGGKFYMREMWRGGARFLTWRDSRATSLIVEKRPDGTSGHWEFKDEPMDWKTAVAHALPVNEGMSDEGIHSYLQDVQPGLIEELESARRGLTVVVGRKATQVLSSNDVVSGGRWNHQRLIDDIRDAPQARRPVRELAISVLVNGELGVERLSQQSVEEDPDWPPTEIEIPRSLITDATLADGAEATIGILRITKAGVQLTGRLKDLNTLFVLDSGLNSIAHYPMRELPFPGHSPILSLLNAEMHLTFPRIDDLVQNDRERLVHTPTTDSLLAWVSERMWERVQAVEELQRSQERQTELQQATLLNDVLNEHAQRFLEELQSQIMVDFIDDPSGGGIGSTGTGTGASGEGKAGEGPRERGTGGAQGTGGTTEVPGTSEPIRRPRLPQVLLSGIDLDPSQHDGTSKLLTDRHPPLDQDDIDRAYNVWWINTAHPFAREAIKYGGPKGHAFKSHQLFMFRDVVQREALRFRQRREAELGLDQVENELSEASNRFLSELPVDLVRESLG